MLKEFSLSYRLSRTHIRDTITPLIKSWDGPVSLEVYDRQMMKDGDIVADFLAKYLPDINPTLASAGATSLAALASPAASPPGATLPPRQPALGDA